MIRKTFFILFLNISTGIYSQNELNKNTFDFWIGHWEVSWLNADSTTTRAQNSIKRILNEKVIQETFLDTVSSFKGKSLSVFNTATNQWHQTWVDNQGAHYNFIGAIENGNPVFKTKMVEKDGKKIIMKMVFKNITKNDFVWEWMGTRDNGKNWTILWKINYKRRNELNSLKQVYSKFKAFVKQKNTEGLEGLFVNEAVPLNTAIRMPDSLIVLSNPFSNWKTFLKSMKVPYELKISKAKYFKGNETAYSIANFNEYVDNKHQAIGKDLFLYINTKKGWRLVALNGTAHLISNTKAEGVANLTITSVENTLKAHLTALETNFSKTKPEDNYSNYATSCSKYLASHSNISYLKTNDSIWITKNLSNSKNVDLQNLNFNFNTIKTEIIDKHMALSKLEYSINKDDSKINGIAYLSVLASNSGIPKITSLLLDRS